MRSRSSAPVRSGHLLGLIFLTLLPAQACTKENVTGVTVKEISVLPPSVTVLRDESVQLVAQVRDEEGRLLETASVTWTSDRPSVVAVSPDGLVSAVGVGPATVRASLGGAEGAAAVLVTARAFLRAEPQSVTLRGAVGSESPQSVRIDIRDEGEEVEDLEASVAYPAGSEDGWLEARLEDDESPTELEVSADVSAMPAGAYSASVLVWGGETRDAPVEIPVSMTVAGIAVQETDGRTLVSGSSGSDEIRVALLLRPDVDVVLSVRSRDTGVAVVSPSELRFTPADWSTPRSLTVTAGSSGGGWWGFQSTEVTVEVERSLSDAAYAPVGEAVVPVTVYRSPFR